MVFKRRVVQVDQPAHTTTVVTPVQQPERTVHVERSGLSAEASVLLILAGLAIMALVWYLAFYRTDRDTTIVTPAATERTMEIRTEPAPTTQAPVIMNPPPVVNNPPQIVTPPAENRTTIINPPADTETTVITAPAETEGEAPDTAPIVDDID